MYFLDPSYYLCKLKLPDGSFSGCSVFFMHEKEELQQTAKRVSAYVFEILSNGQLQLALIVPENCIKVKRNLPEQVTLVFSEMSEEEKQEVLKDLFKTNPNKKLIEEKLKLDEASSRKKLEQINEIIKKINDRLYALSQDKKELDRIESLDLRKVEQKIKNIIKQLSNNQNEALKDFLDENPGKISFSSDGKKHLIIDLLKN